MVSMVSLCLCMWMYTSCMCACAAVWLCLCMLHVHLYIHLICFEPVPVHTCAITNVKKTDINNKQHATKQSPLLENRRRQACNNNTKKALTCSQANVLRLQCHTPKTSACYCKRKKLSMLLSSWCITNGFHTRPIIQHLNNLQACRAILLHVMVTML